MPGIYRYIPGIGLVYKPACHMSGIHQVYEPIMRFDTLFCIPEFKYLVYTMHISSDPNSELLTCFAPGIYHDHTDLLL
jgi:hypothetical protein